MADLRWRIIEHAADYQLNEKRLSTTRVKKRNYCHFLSLFIPSGYAANFRFALGFHLQWMLLTETLTRRRGALSVG